MASSLGGLRDSHALDLGVLGDGLNGGAPPAASLDKITAGYGAHPVILDVSGRFESGTLTAIAGANGAGKSTLMKVMAGVLKPSSGSLTIGNSERLAYLPQRSAIDQSFPITVLDAVLLGHCRHGGWFRAFNRKDRAQALEALSRVGLQALAKRSIADLSAGQFQRVLFARLIVEDAPLILLDEPFNAIDIGTVEHLLTLIQAWHGEGRTIIAVLHDLEQIRAFFPNSLILSRDVIAWGDTAAVLTPENMDRARRGAERRDQAGTANATHVS